ncbi:MAG: putative short chain dehydrogenase [Chlamydiales bacterium]|jgi:3-oxoacyl-[acyl-carrier protein] reductase|nr:putative short chain dehydrogenase [Chlamydiales bacterium]
MGRNVQSVNFDLLKIFFAIGLFLQFFFNTAYAGLMDKNAVADYRKTIVVTGVTGGIGSATAHYLAQTDYNLVLVGRNKEKLQDLQKELSSKYQGRYTTLAVDFNNLPIPVALHDTLTHAAKGKVDGLVLIGPRFSLGEEIIPDATKWQQAFQTSFIAPLQFLKTTLPRMKQGAKIVIISGVTSVQYIPAYGSSAVLRSMWVAESKHLSHQLAPRKIHVNTISPNGVLTEAFRKIVEQRAIASTRTYEEQLALESKEIPLGEYGKPDELAKTIEFLLSDKSNHMTGQNIVYDGGFNLGY